MKSSWLLPWLSEPGRDQEEGGEVSWTLMKNWTIICGSRRDQEEGGGAGPSREPWRDQEQRGGAGLGKLDTFLLQLFLTSCFTDMVFVTLLRTAAETAVSEGSTQVASRWRSPHLLNIAVLEVFVGLFGLWGSGCGSVWGWGGGGGGGELGLFFLLLSLDAHNHVDDYSGTLGGVRKVHISALVTSQFTCPPPPPPNKPHGFCGR